jgi:hypothetical protein
VDSRATVCPNCGIAIIPVVNTKKIWWEDGWIILAISILAAIFAPMTQGDDEQARNHVYIWCAIGGVVGVYRILTAKK